MIEIVDRYDPSIILLRDKTARTVEDALYAARTSKAHQRWLATGGCDGARVSLRRAMLAGQDFRWNLTGFDLTEADLTNANLTDTSLHLASLRDATMTGAQMELATLIGTDLRGVDVMSWTVGQSVDISGGVVIDETTILGDNGDVPYVDQLDAAVLAQVEANPDQLRMAHWHSACRTTHCRGGWAITLAGAAGQALERIVGSHLAGALIYQRSAGYIPDFFTSEELTLADLRLRASKGATP